MFFVWILFRMAMAFTGVLHSDLKCHIFKLAKYCALHIPKRAIQNAHLMTKKKRRRNEWKIGSFYWRISQSTNYNNHKTCTMHLHHITSRSKTLLFFILDRVVCVYVISLVGFYFFALFSFSHSFLFLSLPLSLSQPLSVCVCVCFFYSFGTIPTYYTSTLWSSSVVYHFMAPYCVVLY